MLFLKTEPVGSRFDLARILRSAYWYFITRIRGSFEDFAYVALLVSSLLAYYVLHNLLGDQMGVPLAVRLGGAAEDAFAWSILGLPSILILTIALRLAPR